MTRAFRAYAGAILAALALTACIPQKVPASNPPTVPTQIQLAPQVPDPTNSAQPLTAMPVEATALPAADPALPPAQTANIIPDAPAAETPAPMIAPPAPKPQPAPAAPQPKPAPPTPIEPQSTAGTASPASVFCIDEGGSLLLQGQTSLCLLPDGTMMEEWDYFRLKH